MSPQTIAHYRITARRGEGGMGEVWRATDTKLNRDAAIKILPGDLRRGRAGSVGKLPEPASAHGFFSRVLLKTLHLQNK